MLPSGPLPGRGPGERGCGAALSWQLGKKSPGWAVRCGFIYWFDIAAQLTHMTLGSLQMETTTKKTCTSKVENDLSQNHSEGDLQQQQQLIDDALRIPTPNGPAKFSDPSQRPIRLGHPHFRKSPSRGSVLWQKKLFSGAPPDGTPWADGMGRCPSDNLARGTQGFRGHSQPLASNPEANWQPMQFAGQRCSMC